MVRWIGDRAKRVDAATGLLSLALEVVDAGMELLGPEHAELAELRAAAAELQEATSVGAPLSDDLSDSALHSRSLRCINASSAEFRAAEVCCSGKCPHWV